MTLLPACDSTGEERPAHVALVQTALEEFLFEDASFGALSPPPPSVSAKYRAVDPPWISRPTGVGVGVSLQNRVVADAGFECASWQMISSARDAWHKWL